MRPETKQIRNFSIQTIIASILLMVFALVVELNPQGQIFAFVLGGILLGISMSAYFRVVRLVKEREADEAAALRERT